MINFTVLFYLLTQRNTNKRPRV